MSNVEKAEECIKSHGSELIPQNKTGKTDEQTDVTENIDIVTLDKSNFHLQLGDINYDVLVDLKTLQGKKEPYFNATEIIKQYNDIHNAKKRIVDWTRSKRFKEIINIHGCDFNTRKNVLYRKEKIKGNKYNIFIHRELFLSMMIWLDAKHEIAVTSFVGNVIECIDATKLTRKAVILPTVELNIELDDLAKLMVMEGKNPASKKISMIYVHIQNAVNKTVTGKGVSLDRNTLPHEQLEEIHYLENMLMDRVSILTCRCYTAEEIRNDLMDLLHYIQDVDDIK